MNEYLFKLNQSNIKQNRASRMSRLLLIKECPKVKNINDNVSIFLQIITNIEH